ncbi:MAG: hypothetical protein PHZ19_09980 [Candidatus Thermoplasmatota archaeon]|nr:hypothetical protein [Candidatus Thermoplasmatota archaeon]
MAIGKKDCVPVVCLVHTFTATVNIPIEASSEREAEEVAAGMVREMGGHVVDVMQGEW